MTKEEPKAIIIPTLKNLKISISEMSDEDLNDLIGNVRANRRRLISDKAKIKRKGKKVERKKKVGAVGLMTTDEKEEWKKFLAESFNKDGTKK